LALPAPERLRGRLFYPKNGGSIQQAVENANPQSGSTCRMPHALDAGFSTRKEQGLIRPGAQVEQALERASAERDSEADGRSAWLQTCSGQ
jgi:hypothetical protein